MRRIMILILSTVFLAFTPVTANASVAHDEKSTSTVTVNSYVTEDDEVEVVKEDVKIGNENATFERITYENGVVHAKLTQKDTQTLIEYDPKTNELFVDGEKHEIAVTSSDEAPAEALKEGNSIQAVPKGGKYMGATKYSLNIAKLTASAAAAALSTVTKAPVKACLAALSVFIGANTTVYYTVYQYRYSKKCQSYRYFNLTKVWKNSKREKLHKKLESGMFFASKPNPISCKP
ncbi:hypothetical protein [Kroppenstedtia sanguinis]